MGEVKTTAGTRSADSYLVIQNSFILFLRYVALWGLNSILVLFIPRHLGDQGLGQLQFALSFVSLFTIGIALGVRHFLIKEVARDHGQMETYLGAAIGLRLIMTAIVLPLLVLIANLTGYSTEAKWAIYIAALWMVLTSFAHLMAAFLNGLENMGWPSVAETVGKVVVVAVGVPVLVTGQGVLIYAGVLVAGALVQLLLNVWYIARRYSLRVDFNLPRLKSLVSGGVPFLLMGFLLSVYHHVDVVMLRMLDTEQVVGWYAAAIQIFRSVEFLSMVLTTALLPTMARLHIANNGGLPPMAKRGIALVVLFTAPLAVGISFLSREIISFLPYPDVFQNSVPLLSLLALSIPVTALLTILGTIAIAADRQKTWAIALLSTVTLNIALNAVLIPHFQGTQGNGAIGSATATLISEAFMAAVGVWLMPRGVMDRTMIMTLLKLALACGGMALVAALVQSLGLGPIVLVAGASATYGALVLVTRAVVLRDLLFTWHAVAHRLRAGSNSAIHNEEMVS